MACLMPLRRGRESPRFMKPIIPIFFLLLSACSFFEDDKDDLPPLKQAELVGCWFDLKLFRECYEECYSSSGLAYKKIIFNFSQNSFGEDSGSYEIIGRNVLSTDFLLRYPGTIDERNPGKEERFIRSDTLFGFHKFIRSDSTHNCGPHWNLFIRPSQWELRDRNQ